jgi:hypothetical protein
VSVAAKLAGWPCKDAQIDHARRALGVGAPSRVLLLCMSDPDPETYERLTAANEAC